MIAFFDPPKTDTPDPVATKQGTPDPVATMAAALHAAHQQHIHEVFTEAIMKHTGGQIPSDEELQTLCQTVIDKDGTYHLLWGAPKYQVGDDVDLTYAIVSVGPPKIG